MTAEGIRTLYSGELVINGATTSRDGRLFCVAQVTETGVTPQVVEIRDGRAVPYPDVYWNTWRPGEPGAEKFVAVNSVRVDADGALWAVDRGSPRTGGTGIPGGYKAVRIDLENDSVERVFDLGAVTRPWSFVDDVRFHAGFAYFTDAGSPALIVLDLESGAARRVLEGHPSTVAQKPLLAEGRPLTSPGGAPVNVHVDQLEVSPDGVWLYFQPCCGGMSRIRTEDLEDASLDEWTLAARVEAFAETPSTGGTAIASDGTIYLSAVNDNAIVTVSPDGSIAPFLSDERLAWVDAMWIDAAGDLLLPAAQLNRSAGLNGGRDITEPPYVLYAFALGEGPGASRRVPS